MTESEKKLFNVIKEYHDILRERRYKDILKITTPKMLRVHNKKNVSNTFFEDFLRMDYSTLPNNVETLPTAAYPLDAQEIYKTLTIME